MSRPCTFCEASPAPFGYGYPGSRRDRPNGKTGYIWACSSQDCRDQAEERKSKAEGRT